MKAQVALEFIIIFGVFLVALILVTLSAWGNVMNINKSTIDFESVRILNLAANRMNTVYLEGDGFSIGLVIPEKIGNFNYTINIEDNTLWLEINELSYSKRLLASNITGTLSKGTNTIKNMDGGLVIS